MVEIVDCNYKICSLPIGSKNTQYRQHNSLFSFFLLKERQLLFCFLELGAGVLFNQLIKKQKND
jgi:hypothetical protein